jgi:hypothetical protein
MERIADKYMEIVKMVLEFNKAQTRTLFPILKLKSQELGF